MSNVVVPMGPDLTDKVALNAQDTAGGVLQWVNNAAGPVLITRLVIDIATASTGASTCDFGSAANSTTTSNNLIDCLNTNAVGIFDNIRNGTKTYAKVGSGESVTGSKSPRCAGSVAGLAGFAYITYVVMP